MAAHSTSSVSLTWSAVTARRMARVALTEPSAELDPAGVAAVLCGVHAQLLTAAELSVGRRIAGATCTDVQRALWQDRTLVKTFGPRGTIHLLPAAELPMWTGALSALSSPPTHPEGVCFTPEQIEEVIAAIGEALADAELTVDELTQAIVEHTGPWAVEQTMEAFGGKWPRWRQLTSVAAHRGVMCFGPNRARNVTYTNPARWLPAFRPLDADLALRTLLTRYLYAYGPATPQHVAKWLAISPRSAADLFGRLSADLERVDLEGTPAWALAADTQTPAEPARGIRLLPYFDAYVVAAQPRDRLYLKARSQPARSHRRARPETTWSCSSATASSGGIWHSRRSGRRLAVTVEPLRELSAPQRRQLDDEVAFVAAIMEATPGTDDRIR